MIRTWACTLELYLSITLHADVLYSLGLALQNVKGKSPVGFGLSIWRVRSCLIYVELWKTSEIWPKFPVLDTTSRNGSDGRRAKRSSGDKMKIVCQFSGTVEYMRADDGGVKGAALMVRLGSWVAGFPDLCILLADGGRLFEHSNLGFDSQHLGRLESAPS